MKQLLALACGVTLLASAAWSVDPWTGHTRQPPHRGMTRAEAAAYYGEPYRRAAVGQEERWYYRLKFDEVYGRAWMPFEHDSQNVTLGILTFGADGKVRQYDWKRALTR